MNIDGTAGTIMIELLLVLCAVYVLVCAFRSLLPHYRRRANSRSRHRLSVRSI